MSTGLTSTVDDADQTVGRRRLVVEFGARVAVAVDALVVGDHRGLDALVLLVGECEDRLGSNDRQTLRVRTAVASWRGELGDPRSAQNALGVLYTQAQDILGPTDPDTLLIGSNSAAFTGIAGDPCAAAEMLALILPDVERRFGRGSAVANTVRTNLSVWLARSGAVDHPGVDTNEIPSG